jgi:hypothetical protein
MAIPASIDSLKASINRRGGVARANRYAIYISHPGKKGGLLGGLINTDLGGIISNVARSALSGGKIGFGGFINDPRDMFLFCESCNLPGRQIATQDLFTSQKAYKRPYGYINDQVTMTFNLTNDYYAYNYLKSWMDMIVRKNGENDFHIGYKSEYTGDITIQQLGNTDYIPVKGIKLINAYPVTLSQIALSNTSENSIAQVTVTFEFDDWEEESVVDGILGNLGGTIASLAIDAFG